MKFHHILAETDPQGAWVDTDDLNGPKDGLHYDPSGYAKLGERFAEAAIKIIKNAPLHRPADSCPPR